MCMCIYIYIYIYTLSGLPRWHYLIKNLPANVEDIREVFDPWVGKIPWRRAWQPTLVFLPGESHGQREPGDLQSTGSQRVRHET